MQIVVNRPGKKGQTVYMVRWVQADGEVQWYDQKKHRIRIETLDSGERVRTRITTFLHTTNKAAGNRWKQKGHAQRVVEEIKKGFPKTQASVEAVEYVERFQWSLDPKNRVLESVWLLPWNESCIFREVFKTRQAALKAREKQLTDNVASLNEALTKAKTELKQIKKELKNAKK